MWEDKCQDELANILPMKWTDSPIWSQIAGDDSGPIKVAALQSIIFRQKGIVIFALAVLLCN